VTSDMSRIPRLGLDIGRVIIGGDTEFFHGSEAEMLAAPEIPGAFGAISRLVPLFGGRVHLVSKCGEPVQARTLRWLTAHDFWERTGISIARVRFCRRRKDKQGICAELGITHFADDRLDICETLSGTVPYRYLFGPQQPGLVIPRRVTPVADWTAAERSIVASLEILAPL
jgi:tRNA(Leu) C34 or U34 (ribose-2'-O)-methylase TrmL